ncbi:MAG TPA: ABC transporter substrate-binding protein [Tepidisphaeraceae bacterium]|jgi:NitT/TauT family transport system substrate-binding protein|nr:ABC transporter substrate-binding protein [Tepidisphaeraceae bacterium]
MTSHRIKPSVTLFFLAVLCASLTPGCKHKSPQNAARPVVLMLDWKPEPEFGGFYQAKLGGEFSRRGVNIDIQNASGDAMEPWKQVDRGKADFATTSADLLVDARAHKADVVALFAVYQTSPQGIMVHKARGFKTIGDVFTHPGTLGAEADNAWVKFLLAKFPNPAVTITADPPGIGVFMAKPNYSQQCFITSEPLEVKRQGGDPQTFLAADAGFNPYVTVLITSGKTLREKPELVKKVVIACREGWRAYLDNPSAANKEMGSLNHEMDARTFAECAELQKQFIETGDTRKNGVGTMTAERWKTLIQQLADLKVIHNTMAAEECFVNVK